MKRFIFILSLFLTIGSESLLAQETQVFLDNKGTIAEIDAKLEDKLQLFPEIGNFVRARLFQEDENNYVLEIAYEKNGLEQRKRIAMVLEEVTEFRMNLSQQLGQHAPEAGLNQEGRLEMMLYATGLSVGFYGWAVPSMLEVDDARGLIGLYMLTAGAGFFAPFAFTERNEVTPGQAHMYGYGATRGVAHGVLLSEISSGNASSKSRGKRAAGLGMLMSVGGGIAGYQIAKKQDWDRGTAAAVGSFGDAGGVALPMLVALVGPEDGDERFLYASAILGNVGGMFAGSALAKKQSYRSGDAIVLKTAGITGALVPVSLMLVGEVENPRAYLGGALAGGVLGLTAGHLMTRKVDFNTGQGIIITLGTGAGAAMGFGTGFLVSGELKPAVVGTVLGGVGGFLGTHQWMVNRADKARNNGMAFQFQLAPEGVVGLMNPKTPFAGEANPFGLSQAAPPLVRASLRF